MVNEVYVINILACDPWLQICGKREKFAVLSVVQSLLSACQVTLAFHLHCQRQLTYLLVNRRVPGINVSENPSITLLHQQNAKFGIHNKSLPSTYWHLYCGEDCRGADEEKYPGQLARQPNGQHTYTQQLDLLANLLARAHQQQCHQKTASR